MIVLGWVSFVYLRNYFSLKSSFISTISYLSRHSIVQLPCAAGSATRGGGGVVSMGDSMSFGKNRDMVLG